MTTKDLELGDLPVRTASARVRAMPPGMDPERWARMSITQQARAVADEKMRKYM